MKKTTMILIVAVVLALFAGAVSANTAIGGDRGVIQVACDVEGATVVLVSINGDESKPQTIVDGQTEFSVYSTGTPYKEVKVSAAGYQTATKSVEMPAMGATTRVTVTLTPEEPIGGNRGVIQITSNVEGAAVELISVSGTVAYNSTIKNGQAEFAVYSTGTPVTQVRVSAAGYQTATKPVEMPASGKTSVIDVPLTSNPTPTPTKSPMGLAVLGVLGVIAAVVLIRRD